MDNSSSNNRPRTAAELMSGLDGPEKPLFAASHAKVRRARKFIEELRMAAVEYKNSNPVTGLITHETGRPQLVIAWAGTGLEPGAILGDCIHNMRTALDLMAAELVRKNGGSDKNVYFPFANGKDALPDLIKKHNFDKAGAAAVELLYSIAPYRGGNNALRAVHDLDIRDKHRALILVASTFNAQVTGSYHLEGAIEPTLDVVLQDVFFRFPDGEEFGGEPVLEILEHLVQTIEGILQSFERLCLLGNA